MRNSFNVIIATLITFLFGCEATTTYTVKKPMSTKVTFKTARGDCTTTFINLEPVLALETKEKTFLGTSRTTIREMTFGYKETQEGEALGSVAEAFREDGDRVIDYVERAPLPGNSRDWRQISTFKGFPLYNYRGVGPYSGYFSYRNRLYDPTDAGRLEVKMGLPEGTLPRPYRTNYKVKVKTASY